MEDGSVLVVLDRNVSVGGVDYGPDYGTGIATLPDRWARQFIRIGAARPAMRRVARTRDGLEEAIAVPVRVNPGRFVTQGGREYAAGEIVGVDLPTAERLFGDGAAVPAPIGAPDWSRVPSGPSFCGAHTPRCPNARSYHVPVRRCCRALVRELVRYIGSTLDAYGVTWWADYGMLLGAVRNPLTTAADYPWLRKKDLPEGPVPPGMVPHDKDADIGVLAKDAEVLHLLQHVAHDLGLGWRISGKQTVKFRVSPKNSTNLDAFIWHERANGTLHRTQYAAVDRCKGREFHRDLLFPLTELEWEGLRVPAPAQPEAFLEMRYGTGWRTPIDANHDGVRR